jgi:hypothetical protein
MMAVTGHRDIEISSRPLEIRDAIRITKIMSGWAMSILASQIRRIAA